MNRRLLLPFVFVSFAYLFLVPNQMHAQLDTILHARTIRNTLYITPGRLPGKDGKPESVSDRLKMYGNDRNDEVMRWEHATFDSLTLILVKDGTYNVRLLNPNPLRYKFEISGGVYSQDPYDATMEVLAETIGKLLGTVTGTDLGLLTAEAVMKASSTGSLAVMSATSEAKIDELIAALKDDKLKDALLAAMIDSVPCITAFTADVEALAKVQAELDVPITDMAKEIVQLLNAIDLAHPAVDKSIEGLDDKRQALDAKNVKLAKALSEFEPAYDELKKYCGKLAKDKWSRAVDKHRVEVQTELDARVKLSTELKALIEILRAQEHEVSAFDSRSLEVYSNILPKGKVEAVKVKMTYKEYSLKDRKVESVEAKPVERNLRFMKTHTFYPNVTPAIVVFPRITFTSFSAEADSTGKSVVASTTTGEDWQAAAAMLNFHFKVGRNDEVPFLQIGATVRRESPMFFLGGGMRMWKHFGLAMGAAFNWQQELKTLSVGKGVQNDDEVKNDLIYSLQKPTFYLAFHVNIPGALLGTPNTGLGKQK